MSSPKKRRTHHVVSVVSPPRTVANVSFDSDEPSDTTSELTTSSENSRLSLDRFKDRLPRNIFKPLGKAGPLKVTYHPGSGYKTEYHPSTFAPICTNPNLQPELINQSALLPKREWDELPKVNRSVSQAVYQRKHFFIEYNTLEEHSSSMPQDVGPTHHTTNGTNGFGHFFRKNHGVYLMGNSTRVIHSEVFEHELDGLVTSGCNLGKEYIQMKNGVYNLGGHPFVLCNGEDPKGIIKSICLKEVFLDLCFESQPKTKVLKRTTRGNRAVDLGRTGGQSQKRDGLTGICEPSLTKGSNRYPRLWVAGSELVSVLSEMGGFQRPMNDVSRNLKYSCKIHRACLGIEHMTIICMVHDHLEQAGILDKLIRHLDQENDNLPNYNYLVCAWDTFFVSQLGRNVTMAVVWTTRKSISDHIERERRINRVSSMLMDGYKKLPEKLRIVNQHSFPTDDGSADFEIMGVHLDPLVDLSPCIHWIDRLNQTYKTHFNKFLPTYWVDDIAYSFLMTNNRLRFHRFCTHLFRRWSRKWSRFPLGMTESFGEMFSRWLMKEYGGYNGTNLTLKEMEELEMHNNPTPKEFKGGVTRHQPFSTRPVTKERRLSALNCIHFLCNDFETKGRSGRQDCLKLFRDIQNNVLYLGQLNAVKICYILAAVGRLSRKVLRYGHLGSDHLKQFREHPWFLENTSQLDQVVRHMETQTDELDEHFLASKVDEYLCQYSNGGTGGDAVYIRGQCLWSIRFQNGQVQVSKNSMEWGKEDSFQSRLFPPIQTDDIPVESPDWVDEEFSYRGTDLSPVVLVCHKNLWQNDIQEKLKDKAKNVKRNLLPFRFDVLSDLCFDGQMMCISDPLSLTAKEFRLKKKILEEGTVVTFDKKFQGFVATLTDHVIELMDLDGPYAELGTVQVATPRVGLLHLDGVRGRAYYKTKWLAKLAAWYNVLFNHGTKSYQHITRRILSNCHQYIIVFPLLENTIGSGLMYCVVTKLSSRKHIENRDVEIRVIDYKKGKLLAPRVVKAE